MRRKAASYIHKLAIYIGEEATSKDLLPIFESLVLDLDEVRSGAIDNFAAFLKVNNNIFSKLHYNVLSNKE